VMRRTGRVQVIELAQHHGLVDQKTSSGIAPLFAVSAPLRCLH